ncbi:hypothetical protein [Streptomyces sp. NPDC000133]|uniref:hypothetical protein n=1 Tax=Streptomyces sp. NPDC000133 TaxID=3364535 RepID=UPI00368C9953
MGPARSAEVGLPRFALAAKFTVGYSCDDVTTWHTEPIGGECRDRWPPWEDCDIFGPVTYELKLS